MEHGFLDLIGQSCQVQGEPVEKLSLRRVGGEIANQPAFRRVGAELFQMGLMVLHGPVPPLLL